MSRTYLHQTFNLFWLRMLRTGRYLAIVSLFLSAIVMAQGTATPKETVKNGYEIHQSFDLGGHIADYSGSGAMYDTLVNLQSGPRILNQTLDMHAVEKTKHPFFETLTTASTGYGGDPNNFTIFRMSKGKLYDFKGFFRRDRQYFDYDLLANPLIPAISNPYVPVLNSPHLFNTVRRMTDVNFTLFPISTVSFRVGYSQNIHQGPSYSSIHNGADALLLQNWRYSSDSWRAGVDWKILPKTTFSYDEIITHFKENTNWQLTGLNYQLVNGTPVSIGINIFTANGSPCAAPISNSSTTPPTVNPRCNGYLQYYRYQPTRTLFPTEEFRFQSFDLKNIQMNGRFRYTGANSSLPEYNEYFNGLVTRTSVRAAAYTGSMKVKRVSVSLDAGIVWQINNKFSLSDQYDFWYFRDPGSGALTETDQPGTSMLVPPGAPGTPTVTADQTFLGQKTETNTFLVNWQVSSRASFSIGHRYRSRDIAVTMPDGSYTVPIHQNGGILGVMLQPVTQWKINGSFEASYADNSYTQISPRQWQHYRVRSTYKPKPWMTFSGAVNIFESRDNVAYVHHLDHSRSYSAGASIAPNEHYSLDVSYGYSDIFTRTDICYIVSPASSGLPSASPTCVDNGAPYLGTGSYNAPTQYGAIGVTLAPVRKLRSAFGYRMSAVDGTAEFLNPRQVPGSLQSQYQSPYANIAWTLAPGWIWKADWNYYGYGEGTPIGPTLPRSFRGNVYTLGMHYEF